VTLTVGNVPIGILKSCLIAKAYFLDCAIFIVFLVIESAQYP